MDTFPQEIVDMIIDQLANYILSSSGKPANISWYSTISRQRVARTQKYLFESVHFDSQSGLEKWCRAIEPNPAGVSRHVHELSLRRVHQLEGLDSHIRAFACIEALIFYGCDILLSPPVAKSFAPLRSTLVRLTIDSASTTYGIITSLLAALPHLRHLRAHLLDVFGDLDMIRLPPRVPFFEDADSLDLSVRGGLYHKRIDWIPPSAQFRDLRIDAPAILDKSGRVSRWIASSSKSLKFLSIKATFQEGAFLNLFQ